MILSRSTRTKRSGSLNSFGPSGDRTASGRTCWHQTRPDPATATHAGRRLARISGPSGPSCNTADLGASWLFLLSSGWGGFCGCDDGDRVGGLLARLARAAVFGAFEFPVGHLALDHAGVAAQSAFEQVALYLSQGPGQRAGQP